MTRWLAGAFDPRGHLDASRLADALAPRPVSILDCPPLRVAYSGPAARSTDPLCLFDGHLDNAAEIHAELAGETGGLPPKAAGSPPAKATGGQPEDLLAAGYRRWGRALLGRLRGDFVLIIWDREHNEGLLARDQLGVRPLFLHDTAGELCFASEPRHLLALLARRPAPDPVSVAHWIAVSNRPGLSTLYSGVRRLSPGSMLLLRSDGVREERYWAPRFEEPLEIPDAQLAERMLEALERAVRRRIDADGLTGVTMSGGLDSSSVAALAVKQAGDRVRACSATFPEHPAADEHALIDTLREHLAIPAIAAEVRPGGLVASALESLATWQSAAAQLGRLLGAAADARRRAGGCGHGARRRWRR